MAVLVCDAPEGEGLVQMWACQRAQVLSTGALKMFMAFLPTLLMAIISNVLTLKAGTWAQLKLQERQAVALESVSAFSQSHVCQVVSSALAGLVLLIPGADAF